MEGLGSILSSFFVGSVNLLIDTICVIIGVIFGILPKSPFTVTPIEWGYWGDIIGVVIPAHDMIVHFTALTGAVLLYFVGRYLLRLVRMVG